MKHTVLQIALLLWGVCYTAGKANSQTNPNPNSSVDAFILDVMNTERLPGVSTVIVKNNKIVWIKSYGLADVANAVPVKDTTVFLLASVSKLFTGTAVMQLAENNTIQLDNNVNSHLPWALQIPGFSGSPITFRQLMTHSASIQDNFAAMDTYYDYPDPSISLADCMERYFSVSGSDYSPTDNFLPNAPGTVFEYSNMGTALNGYLAERITGMPFHQYCRNEIFNPLCMNNTSWFFSDFDSAEVARPYQYSGGNYIPYAHYGFADYPDGQLRSSVKDMANFMIAYLNNGNFGSNSILSASSINQMWTQQIPSLYSYMGLNWFQEILYHDNGSALVWGHNGGEKGASTELYIDPINKIGICVLTNGEGIAINICDELYNYALTLDATSGYDPVCQTADIIEHAPNNTNKTLIKITDFLGREIPMRTNTPMIKIYSDGSTEKVFIIE